MANKTLLKASDFKVNQNLLSEKSPHSKISTLRLNQVHFCSSKHLFHSFGLSFKGKLKYANTRSQAIQNPSEQLIMEQNLSNVENIENLTNARIAQVYRKTNETEIKIEINLDGNGKCISKTGIPFLDHMFDQLSSHGLFDLEIYANGDLHIDDHHTVEDIALALGTALSQALGNKKGIHRFGNFSAPLDEALINVVLDLSGRPHLSCNLEIPTQRVGNFDTQLVEHFFQSLVNTSGMTLHIRQLAGKNSHHIIEATFKAFARALRIATEVDHRRINTIPSSKGVLSQS